MTPYANTQDYLAEAFRLITLRLHCEIVRVRCMRAANPRESFLGLFLSDEEVDLLLAGMYSVPLPTTATIIDLDAEIVQLEDRIAARLSATHTTLRPHQLVETFQLAPLAVPIILLALAFEVDSRFSQVYAYLQNDVSRRWLSPGLALRLIDRQPSDPAARALFYAEEPLIRYRLIALHTPAGQVRPPLIDRPLKLDDRVVEYLFGSDAIAAPLRDLAELRHYEDDLDALPCDPETRQALLNLCQMWRTGKRQHVLLRGARGIHKTLAAGTITARLGYPLLLIDCDVLARRTGEDVAELLRLAVREALLQGAILHLRHVDALDAPGQAAAAAIDALPVIFSAVTPSEAFSALPAISFDLPGYALRRRLWQTHMNGSGDANLVDVLAGRFKLTPGQIEAAVQQAQEKTWLRDGLERSPHREDYFAGSRAQSNPSLEQLAHKIVAPHVWADLVLPAAQVQQLQDIVNRVRHAHTVMQEWGFAKRLGTKQGVMALFSGPSGTGKSMAAGILAQALGLDMYKIDLSGVVSKYIGETEKNLNRIFAEASAGNVVLFFDEADALFGKRSEVKDAHDRYANIEISYLLQRMEFFDGITILATNFSQNMDEAFTRRLDHVVEFPFPRPDDRERIWRSLFPPDAPLADEIDFAFLAGQFELAGGNIKNCALTAAFYAAESDQHIGMAHLLQAVARELQKLGRPLSRAAFADYYNVARGKH
jgi:SpoVK/Ycf46/Vps4 family AAA+-type ATPase